LRWNARKTHIIVGVVLIVFALAAVASAQCVTLKAGTLVYQPGNYMAGQAITTGVNPYGYNYQAHLFNGTYFNAYANGAGFPPYDGDDTAYLAANPTAAGHWAWPYRNDEVAMKWNDAWLSNKDCNGDGKLDRPDDLGGTYDGSGAWETNHQKGVYSVDGKDYNWTYFVKIVAAPADAVSVPPNWVAADGTIIGPSIWSAFATIQEIYNDVGSGAHGVAYLSPYSAGFGRFGPK
jgi:hypothetical protein